MRASILTWLAALALTVLSMTGTARAADGLVGVKSDHDVATTADRLVAALESKGLTVFARIDHAAGATRVGLGLPPTEVVIFGNPRVGTPLMRCAPSVAIDLPQKALIWQDADGQVWLAYNDPAYLQRRHDIAGCDAVLDTVAQVLGNFATAATSGP